MTLKDYIQEHFNGNQSAFAASVGVLPQQVTKWLKRGAVVFEGKLYSFRRDING